VDGIIRYYPFQDYRETRPSLRLMQTHNRTRADDRGERALAFLPLCVCVLFVCVCVLFARGHTGRMKHHHRKSTHHHHPPWHTPTEDPDEELEEGSGSLMDVRWMARLLPVSAVGWGVCVADGRAHTP
jgi:hypothetical protein